MRQLVRFGTARQVYKPGELIFPNRPGRLPPPPIPAGWDFGLRVGQLAGPPQLSGFRNAVAGARFGAMNPTTYLGHLVATFYVNASNNILFIYFNWPGVQLPGMVRVIVTAEGFAGSVSVPWNGANIRYSVTSAPFTAFLAANIGKVVGVTMVASPTVLFEAPYPWEPFTTHATLNEWVEELDLEVPENWFSLTIAGKKAYLAETYGDG
jgi:hypothetical protein